MRLPRFLITQVLAIITGVLTILSLLGVLIEISEGKDPGNVPVMVAVFWLVVAIYFTPTLIADYRQKHNLVPIALINLFLGWFFGIGWVVTLIWSLMYDSPVREAPPIATQVIVNAAPPASVAEAKTPEAAL
jgi:hypothetical protein